MIWMLIFFTCILALFLLPLAPALIEWYWRSDAQPLTVVRAHDGNIRFFAGRFRDFMEEHLPGITQGSVSATTPTQGKLGKDTYQLVTSSGMPTLSASEKAAQSTSQVLLGTGPLKLQGDMFYEKEVYAAGDIQSGDRNSFRALLSSGDITLGDECDVARWAHSDASIFVGRKNRLYGRVSAEVRICLQRDTRFGRIYAPAIHFGEPSRAYSAPTPQAEALTEMAKPDRLVDQGADRWLIAGSLEIPPGSLHRGELESKENLVVGAGSRLEGSLKSNGMLQLGNEVCISGAVVATGNVHVGRDCRIAGPVVSENRIVIASGSVIGDPNRPTTITAQEIHIEEGALVHGSIWARELGYVAPTHS
jgi:cytoskeletal protein CcmA (bactofilin family)